VPVKGCTLPLLPLVNIYGSHGKCCEGIEYDFHADYKYFIHSCKSNLQFLSPGFMRYLQTEVLQVYFVIVTTKETLYCADSRYFWLYYNIGLSKYI